MARFTATIRVRPKGEVRDPQGEAVAGALRALGFEVADVRTGKEIVVRFDAADENAARAYHALHVLNTRPGITYLSKVIRGDESEGEGHA